MKQASGVKNGQKTVRRKKTLSLSAAEGPKRVSISAADLARWYKPIKKPVTLRLDADQSGAAESDAGRKQIREVKWWEVPEGRLERNSVPSGSGGDESCFRG
jgi:hypothetical protein